MTKLLWGLWALLLLAAVSACSASIAVTGDPQSPGPQTIAGSTSSPAPALPLPEVTAPQPTSSPASALPRPEATAPQPQGAKTQKIVNTASPRLYLLEGGIIARPLNNGAVVPIAKEVSAEIYIAPYPPAPEIRLDLYLFEPRSGVSITNAEVIVKYEMLYMDHGQYRLNATEKGNGHYLAPLDFGMYGEWVVDVYAGSGEQSGSVRLEIVVAP